MESGTIVSLVIGVATLLLTTLLTYFAFVVKTNSRLVKLETGYEVFWKVLEPHLANIIHSPIHVRRDELVEKMVTGKLSREEGYELLPMLKECFNNCNTPDQKIAAALLLARLSVIANIKEKKK